MPASASHRSSARLPACVRELLWEYDADVLRWETDDALITGRVLSEGSWEAVAWLRAQAGDDALRRWIVEREGRGLGPRQLRFWQLVLDLPEERVDDWVMRQERSVWQQRTAADAS